MAPADWRSCTDVRRAALNRCRLQDDKKFLQSLENGVRFGKWILLENIGESVDASLEPLLLQQRFRQGGAEMLKLGDSVVPYNEDFRYGVAIWLHACARASSCIVCCCFLLPASCSNACFCTLRAALRGGSNPYPHLAAMVAGSS